MSIETTITEAAAAHPHDRDVQRLHPQTVPRAEPLTGHTPGQNPPQANRTAHRQRPCHRHAVMGHRADDDVSEACAERVLLPASAGFGLRRWLR
jgi:hypothetical protein